MPITRKFVINCPSEDFCQELLSILLENLPSYNMYYRIRNNKIEIHVTGLKTEINHVWSMIKTYKQMLMNTYMKDEKGLSNIPVKYIVMHIRKTFPPDILVTILSIKGYKAVIEGEIIKTNASKNEVFTLANMIADRIEELKYRAIGRNTKKIIVTTSILLNKNIDETIEVLKNKDILEEIEEDKYKAKVNFEQALSTILRQYINTKDRDRG